MAMGARDRCTYDRACAMQQIVAARCMSLVVGRNSHTCASWHTRPAEDPVTSASHRPRTFYPHTGDRLATVITS